MKFYGSDKPVGSKLRGFGALAILGAAIMTARAASATDPKIAVGEIAPPPPSAGVDVASLRDAAEGEIREIDAATLPPRRRFVVSLAVVGSGADPYACTINAMIRDARTGVMIGVIEAGARADGPAPSLEVRKKIASAAVRSAVRRIPTLVGAETK